MKRWIFVVSFLAVTSFAAPQPRDGWKFVACVPTANECMRSCPRPHFEVRIEPKRCNPQDFRERLACYCFLTAIRAR